MIGGVISSLPVYMMWSLPAVGWLMFCSAWARSKPFLWAVLVPVLACVIVSMTDILPGLDIRHDLVWYTVVYRGLLSVVPGAWFPTLERRRRQPAHRDQHAGRTGQRHRPDPQLARFRHRGPVDRRRLGVALIVGAIHLRRWRESE